jgi:peptide-methionine (R)-S-oxide reductase
MIAKITKPDAEWKKQLTPEQYHVTREKGTERAFSGAYWDNHADGVYRCVCCDTELFSSKEKFDSGTGWPSYWQPVDPANVRTADDYAFFAHRTEVLCAVCDAHLTMCSTMVPSPPGCAIASTLRRSL